MAIDILNFTVFYIFILPSVLNDVKEEIKWLSYFLILKHFLQFVINQYLNTCLLNNLTLFLLLN